MSNHLRNIRALFENAKSFKVSRKVDTYEYESLEKMILDDNIRYSEIIEIFTDKDVKQIESHKEFNSTSKKVEWEVDDYHLQRLKELGLDNEDEDSPNQYISRI